SSGSRAKLRGRRRSTVESGIETWRGVSLGVVRPRGIPHLTGGDVYRGCWRGEPEVGRKDAGGQPGKGRFQATTFYDRRVSKKRQDLTKPRGFGATSPS